MLIFLKNFFPRIPIALTYYIKAKTIYDIHSPYITNIIQHTFCKKIQYSDLALLRNARKNLKENVTVIPEDEYAIIHRQNGSNIGEYTGKVSSTFFYMQSLYRLAQYSQPKSILELGGGVGLSTLSLALAAKNAKMVCIEGSEFLCGIISNVLYTNQMDHVLVKHELVENYLHNNGTDKFDFIFMDANHTQQATLEYFDCLWPMLNENGILVLDDIHWSKGMYNAWLEICKNPIVPATLECFRWGFVFKNNALSKQNLTYIPLLYKPWRLGFW